MKLHNSRMIALATAVSAGALACVIGQAGQASAAALPASCKSYSAAACLFYDGNGVGAVWKLAKGYWVWADLAGQRFGSTGDGHGQYVKNNAASAADPLPPAGTSVLVFYNEHCTGPHDKIAGFTEQNLVQTWNDEASLVNTGAGDYPC